jgi:hypothetical protein
MMHPHDWDGDSHRMAIHLAFDIWFACYMSTPRNTRQVAHWRGILVTLTADAARRKALHEEQARIGVAFLEACAGLAEAV